MSDLISRQAAIDALKKLYYAAEKWGKESSDDMIKARAESCMAGLIEMKLRIEKMPSAQPEQKTGRWIKKTDENCWWYECSECGDYPMKNAYGHEELSAYCPHCGAKMESEDKE